MLSSLEALAGKISPGSGKSSPNQLFHGAETNNNNNTTKGAHFNQNIHPYQKLDHNSNREK